MNICIIRSSLILNSISYDAVINALNGQCNIHEINELYFHENNISTLESNFDFIIIICSLSGNSLIHSIPYSSKYVIVVDDTHLPDEIDISWHKFQTHIIVSFSRSIHEKMQSYGLKSSYFQYYPLPEADTIQWMASDEIVKLSVLGEEHILKTKPPVRAEGYLDIVKNGNFQIFEEEVTIKNLYSKIEKYDIFMITDYSYWNFSAVLAIMSHGKIVISRELPWISEYIGHLSSGIIDGRNNFQYHPPLDTQSLLEIGRGAHHRTRRGHRRWLADRARLLSLIMNDGQRWSSSDRSASFGNRIRRAASNAAYEAASPEI